MTKPHRRAGARGFTLIELIIFIVVVSAGLAGILAVSTNVVKSSADPMVRKQAMALADSILEEILLKRYCDPDRGDPEAKPPICIFPRIPADQETLRADYDDVEDYNAKSNAVFADLPTELSSYVIGIDVADGSATLGVAAKRVTVTITHGTDVVSMTGYRANY